MRSVLECLVPCVTFISSPNQEKWRNINSKTHLSSSLYSKTKAPYSTYTMHWSSKMRPSEEVLLSWMTGLLNSRGEF